MICALIHNAELCVGRCLADRQGAGRHAERARDVFQGAVADFEARPVNVSTETVVLVGCGPKEQDEPLATDFLVLKRRACIDPPVEFGDQERGAAIDRRCAIRGVGDRVVHERHVTGIGLPKEQIDGAAAVAVGHIDRLGIGMLTAGDVGEQGPVREIRPVADCPLLVREVGGVRPEEDQHPAIRKHDGRRSAVIIVKNLAPGNRMRAGPKLGRVVKDPNHEGFHARIGRRENQCLVRTRHIDAFIVIGHGPEWMNAVVIGRRLDIEICAQEGQVQDALIKQQRTLPR